MKLFLSNVTSYEKILELENINKELISLLKDEYIFFYEEILKMVYFCEKDVIKKMKVLNNTNIDFPIYSESFNLFHFFYHPISSKILIWNSIESIETRICKNKDCFIDTNANITKTFYIIKKNLFMKTDYQNSPYPHIKKIKTIPKLLEKTTYVEYDVCIKFLQSMSGHFTILEDIRKEESLMKFNLTYPINYLFKFETKQDFFEDILEEPYPYDLNILKFDTGHELIHGTKLFVNKEGWEDVYNYSKNEFEKINILHSSRLRFSGMFLLHKYLIHKTKTIDEELLEDYITLLYHKKEKINSSIYNIKQINEYIISECI